MKTRFLILILLLALGTAFVQAQDAQTPEEICAAATPAADPETRSFERPEEVLQPDVDYRAVFCTEAGPVYVDLFEDFTPLTVNSFVFLANNGYFNNTTFHRVLQDFMAQGGDPTGTGTSGPGYQFGDEFAGFLNFDEAGILAMANAGPGTNGSQFFITTAPTGWLHMRHTVFGKVLEGQENVENLRLRDPQQNPDFEGAQLQTVVIITDPAQVESAYESQPPATEEEIAAAFTDMTARINERFQMPEGLIETSSTGILTTEETVASQPEDQQSAYAEFLAAHNHRFSISAEIANPTCDVNLPFTSMRYTLNVFETAEDAAAAESDDFTAAYPTALGFDEGTESPYLSNRLYTQPVTECEREGVRALSYWQRGRFLATIEITVAPDQAEVADLYLTDIAAAQLFEYLAGDVLQRELLP